jgi:hypothetical protein
MDIKGLNELLSNEYQYHFQTKKEFIDKLKKEFKKLKAKGIDYLMPIPGKCNCPINNEGYTFLDEKHGYFFNIVIEEIDTKILSFKQCMHLKNENELESKKNIIYMPYNELDGMPF